MKTFSELTQAQQDTARARCLEDLLLGIIDGAIRFDDEANQDDLQARIDRAAQQADKMRTPWFAHEYIMETAGEELLGMAGAQAEDAIYGEKHEHVIAGIA